MYYIFYLLVWFVIVRRILHGEIPLEIMFDGMWGKRKNARVYQVCDVSKEAMALNEP